MTIKIRAPIIECYLSRIHEELKGIRMDTSSLKTAFSDFSTDFGKFANDLTAYLQKNADTPEQIADVKTVVDGLAGLKTQVDTMDAALNPPAA